MTFARGWLLVWGVWAAGCALLGSLERAFAIALVAVAGWWWLR